MPVVGCRSAVWRSYNKSCNYLEVISVSPGASGASSWLSKCSLEILEQNHGTTLKLSVSHLEPVVPVVGCQSVVWRSYNKSWNYLEVVSVSPGASGASSWLSKCSLEILEQIMELP